MDTTQPDAGDALAGLTAEELADRYNRAGELLALTGESRPMWRAAVTAGEFYLAYPRQSDYRCSRSEVEQGVRRMEAVLLSRRARMAAAEIERAEREYWAARDVRTLDEPPDTT